MSPWVLGAVAGLGAAWFLDAAKHWVTIPTRWKAPAFLLVDAVVWSALTLTALPLPRVQTLAGSALLSLATGKMLHSVTSTLQAAKDRNRVSVVTNRR